ncbi:cation:proton antiporter domain-containing protein [Streptosporangium sp. V21-05]|uniref:cation:proton antiporter domain-containing protein n=1 Tax=Streptosporangium sp. V21-05 TaxID=3446115 RepID=UPI003F5352FC
MTYTRFRSANKRTLRRSLIAYGLAVVLPSVLALLMLALDPGTATGPVPVPSVEPGREEAVPATPLLLLSITVVVALAHLGGAVLRGLGQPRVIGEMAAGIVLGPSLLGAVWPEAYGALFPSAVMPYLNLLAQFGLAFFMFLVGLELRGDLLRGRGRIAVLCGQASVAIPFALGVALALLIYTPLATAPVGFPVFALFIGAALSVTAFPVLARILLERGLFHTPTGALTVTCAAIADVTAWLLLAVAVTMAKGSSPAEALRTLGLTVAFAAFMVWVVRPLLTRLLRRGLSQEATLPIVIVGLLVSGLLTELIGIHLIFGAFLFGVLFPRDGDVRLRRVRERTQDFTTSFLLPPFFAFVGLNTQIGLLSQDLAMWGWCLLILVVAVVGKVGGVLVIARPMGVPGREAMRLGVLMNCRGVTELVILSIGLSLGIVTQVLFTMLVIVALVSTAATAPLLGLLDRWDARRDGEAARDGLPAKPGESEGAPGGAGAVRRSA